MTPLANPLLSVTAQEFFDQSNAFIGRMVASVFNTGEQAGRYYVFDAENMLEQPERLERGPGASYVRVKPKLSDDAFACTETGVETPVDDSYRNKYANGFNADAAMIRARSRNILAAHEANVAEKALDASIAGTAAAGVWTDANGAAIHQEIVAAKQAVRDGSGMTPNKIVIPHDVWVAAFETSAYFLDLIKFTQRGVMTPELVSSLIGLEVLVPDGAIATNRPGGTLAVGEIWGDPTQALVFYGNNDQDLEAPNLMRTFAWTGDGAGDVSVETYRDDTVRSDVHRVRWEYDVKLTGRLLGHRITGVSA